MFKAVACRASLSAAVAALAAASLGCGASAGTTVKPAETVCTAVLELWTQRSDTLPANVDFHIAIAADDAF